MGRKSKIFYYSVLFVNIIIFILSLLPINFPFFRMSFPFSLALIGVLLIIRSMNLKIDSSMFFGVILFLLGVLNGVNYFGGVYYNLNSNQLWPYYLFSVSIASFITFLYFKDKFQGKICILFMGFGLLTLLFVKNLLILWVYILLMILWFIAYFTFNIMMSKRR